MFCLATVAERGRALLTIRRPNIDDEEELATALEVLAALAERYHLIRQIYATERRAAELRRQMYASHIPYILKSKHTN